MITSVYDHVMFLSRAKTHASLISRVWLALRVLPYVLSGASSCCHGLCCPVCMLSWVMLPCVCCPVCVALCVCCHGLCCPCVLLCVLPCVYVVMGYVARVYCSVYVLPLYVALFVMPWVCCIVYWPQRVLLSNCVSCVAICNECGVFLLPWVMCVLSCHGLWHHDSSHPVMDHEMWQC